MNIHCLNYLDLDTYDLRDNDYSIYTFLFSSNTVTLQYQSEGYHVVLVFDSAKVLETFMMVILLIVTAMMILCLLKWIISLAVCYLQNLFRKKEVI